MLRHQTTRLVVKKIGVGAAQAGGANVSGKLQNEEKFSLAALEYVYESNLANDGVNKRAGDVAKERRVSEAHDRYAHILDTEFDRRVDRLTARMNEALAALPEEYLEEATLFNSEAPPAAYRLPKQSPPIPGFEPAFGLDVPQLRVAQLDETPTPRATDRMQLQATLDAMDELDSLAAAAARRAEEGGKDGDAAAAASSDNGDDDAAAVMPRNPFPFVDAPDVRALLRSAQDKMETLHGQMREAVPLTGTSGEEWEAHCALQHCAFARQQLILDLAENPDLRAKYEEDDAFAAAERERRGILPMLAEEAPPPEFNVFSDAPEGKAPLRVLPLPLPEMHYAQSPKYHAFRE